MIRSILIVSVLALAVSLASGQTVFPPVMAHPPNAAGTGYAEALVVLSGNDVVVAYNDAAQYFVRYSISFNGGLTFTPPSTGVQFVGQDCALGAITKGVDPMGARAANGDIVIGGRCSSPPSPPRPCIRSLKRGWV